jgi:uncharacterized protein YjbI with pentapeptide repeats
VGRPTPLPARWTLVDGYLGRSLRQAAGRQARRSDLAGTHLGEASLFGADLAGTNLSGAKLISARLGRADVQGADLSGVIVSAAEFRFTDLRGANLSGAVIQGSDLRSAHLEGARLAGAVWRNDVCPDGTQSSAVGNTWSHDLLLKAADAPWA